MAAALKQTFDSSGSLPQASELLATHSIRELRQLVESLQSDCGSKQTELQIMVGSKYHDFIESADAISSMHVAADSVGKSIAALSSLGKDVIEKSLALLDSKVPQSVVNSIAQKMYNNSDLSAAKVWTCLNSCDVFEASELLVTSGIVSSLLKGDDKMATMWITSKLSKNSELWEAFQKHASCDLKTRPLYGSKLEMLSLRQLVLEDGFFLLLLANEKDVSLTRPVSGHGASTIGHSAWGPTVTPRQIADTITALAAVREFNIGDMDVEAQLQGDSSVFSSSLDPSMVASSYIDFINAHNVQDVANDMLKLYLNGVTERIFTAVEGMMDVQDEAHVEDNHDSWNLHVCKLLNAIEVLQRAIVDVYMIFFHQRPLQTSQSGSNECRTLIEACCSDFCAGVVNRLNALLAESCTDGSSASAEDFIFLRSIGHPLFLGTGSSIKIEDSRRKLHDTWAQWMYGRRGPSSSGKSQLHPVI